MFAKLKSVFSRPNLTEENVIKEIHNWEKMFFGRPHFAKEYVGVEVFQQRKDLRQRLLEDITEEMKAIVASENPPYFFRKKIIDNTKVHAINGVLLREEFSKTRDTICDSINRGKKYLSEHWVKPGISYEQATALIENVENFFAEPWNYRKIVHEFSWAEVESLALRHMQVLLFQERVSHSDWWNLYRQAYEEYIEKAYRLIASNPDKPEGFPHPLLIALTNDTLMGMEDTILESVEQ